MKLTEENELILSLAREFASKEVKEHSLEIERNGIPQTLLSKMAGSGFLAATLPEKLGGAGLDSLSYLLLLETLAMHSPSLSFYTYLQNSLVLGSLAACGEEDAAERMLAIASGAASGTVVADDLISNRGMNSLLFNSALHQLAGRAEFVVHPAASVHVVSTGDGTVLMVSGGISQAGGRRRLGFRGLGFAQVEYSSTGGDVVRLCDGQANNPVAAAMKRSSAAVAAVALGIAEGTIAKAVDYSKTRKTFGSRLEEYKPVAYSISAMQAEIEVLREYLYSNAASAGREGLIAKLLITDAAVRASKLSMQVHGGNGYFEEYQIEKYYRDAMALESLAGNRNAELTELAHHMLGNGSASI